VEKEQSQRRTLLLPAELDGPFVLCHRRRLVAVETKRTAATIAMRPESTRAHADRRRLGVSEPLQRFRTGTPGYEPTVAKPPNDGVKRIDE
jgi:hypothetical protein